VTRQLCLAIVVAALAGCATASSGAPDGGPGPTVDASQSDTGPPPSAPREAREITSGGQHVTGGTIQMDIQVGHGVGQQRMSGGTFQMEGAAAVKR
jgi:hypothetical protein